MSKREIAVVVIVWLAILIIAGVCLMQCGDGDIIDTEITGSENIPDGQIKNMESRNSEGESIQHVFDPPLQVCAGDRLVVSRNLTTGIIDPETLRVIKQPENTEEHLSKSGLIAGIVMIIVGVSLIASAWLRRRRIEKV